MNKICLDFNHDVIRSIRNIFSAKETKLPRSRGTCLSTDSLCFSNSISQVHLSQVGNFFFWQRWILMSIWGIFGILFRMCILRRENIFKPTTGQECLHQDSNDNGIRLVNFATSKNLVVKSTMFPHRNIHKHTWTSPDGKTHNQTDPVLIDRRWHLSVLDVRSFRGADCDTDHFWWLQRLGKD